MATLNVRRESARKLDIEKRKLEVPITKKLEQVFKDMADDASNLYGATGNIPSQELANNYSPEFLKEIRDAMRKSIRAFGFNLRGDLERKHNFLFDIETKARLIDLELKQTVRIQDEGLEPKIESINNQFLVESTVFVANESENQNDLVTETNVKMLDAAIVSGIAAFTNLITKRQREIDNLSSRLVGASPREGQRIARQIDAVNRQIEAANNNQRAIVAENIRTNLLERAPARSELISAQNVGLAESWARQTEAELIDNANLTTTAGQTVSVTKTWFPILDSRTRESHVAADQQEVGVNDTFLVDGERLKFPRDPNGSAKNIINCRCISNFEIN